MKQYKQNPPLSTLPKPKVDETNVTQIHEYIDPEVTRQIQTLGECYEVAKELKRIGGEIDILAKKLGIGGMVH